MKHVSKMIVIGVGLVLTGCKSITGAELFNKTTEAYDGAWIGVMTVGFRLENCRLTRGGLRVRIDGGRINGQARFQTTSGIVEGVIGEDGTLLYAGLTGQYEKDDVEFTGKFEESRAGGSWENKVCSGEWELRKAR